MESKKKIYKCKICAKRFKSVQLLKDHKESHKIGTWFVCKRCLQPFDRLSAIKRHHESDKPCEYSLPDLPRRKNAPDVVVNKLHVMKGIEDNGGEINKYFEKVIERDNRPELFLMLDTVSMSDLENFLATLKASCDDVSFIQYLSSLADFSNRDDVSAEKITKIKSFVLESTRL